MDTDCKIKRRDAEAAKSYGKFPPALLRVLCVSALCHIRVYQCPSVVKLLWFETEPFGFASKQIDSSADQIALAAKPFGFMTKQICSLAEQICSGTKQICSNPKQIAGKTQSIALAANQIRFMTNQICSKANPIYFMTK